MKYVCDVSATPNLMPLWFADDTDDEDIEEDNMDDEVISQATFLSAVEEMSHCSQTLSPPPSNSMTMAGIYTRNARSAPKPLRTWDEF